MGNVKIITFHAVPNYGAVMQAYAMCKAVESLGHDVELIDYAPSDTTFSTEEMEKFKSFIDEYIPLTPRKVTCAEDLSGMDADYFICGSDQIWNLSMRAVRESFNAYFLCFEHDARLISYAASTGGTAIPADLHDPVKKALTRFSAISVREPESVNDISGVTDKPIHTTLDPTLLCKSFPEHKLGARFPEEYIVVYSLQTNPILIDTIRKIKKHHNVPIVSIGKKTAPLADISITDLHPAEWTTAIKNSLFVITNSFHGTVFSIKYRKQFASIPLLRKRSKRKCKIEEKLLKLGMPDFVTCLGAELKHKRIKGNLSPKNSRIKNILHICGLDNRFIERGQDISYLLDPIAYGDVEPKLEKQIEESFAFLENALSNVR